VAPPAISAVAPGAGLVNGGETVVITGTNFYTPATVKFGTVAASCTVDSLTKLTCTAPAQATGTVDIVVATAYGTITKTGGYTYEIPYLDLTVSPDNVGFTVKPNEGVNSEYVIATVKTNNPGGYTLTLEAANSDLVCEDDAGFVIPSIASDGALTIAAGNHGAWGWNVVVPASSGGAWTGGVPNKPVSWRKLPAAGVEDLITSSSAESAVAGDDYGLYFGAVVDWAQAACRYRQGLVVTVVGE
jgi:hypothetical protein